MSDSDYCQKYFPHCRGGGLGQDAARVAACTKLGGKINECGCCMCLSPYSNGGNGWSACLTCINIGPYRCAGKTCPTGSCGLGRFCGPDGCSTCKPGCRCIKGARTLCPLVPHA